MKKQEFIEQYAENAKRSLNATTDVYELSDNLYCYYCPIAAMCSQNGHCAELLDVCIDDMNEV